jgi:hypothetical protein
MLHLFNEGKLGPGPSLRLRPMMLTISTNKHVCVEESDLQGGVREFKFDG